MWDDDKTQAVTLELVGAKCSSSKTSNKTVKVDMGLEAIGIKAKLKLWYKLAIVSEDKYPGNVFYLDWDAT